MSNGLARLRTDDLWARGVALSVDYLTDLSWHESRRTGLFQDSLTFWEEVMTLYDRCPYKQFPPLRLAVTAIDVIEMRARPVPLFDRDRRRLALAEALDAVNDKYGSLTIGPASIVGYEKAAPDRIPFGRAGVPTQGT